MNVRMTVRIYCTDVYIIGASCNSFFEPGGRDGAGGCPPILRGQTNPASTLQGTHEDLLGPDCRETAELQTG